MDGGAEHMLPLHRAAELGATGIVAVDPGSTVKVSADAVVAGGMLAMHERVFSIMSGRLRRQAVDEWDGPPLLYLRPELEGYGSFDFAHVPYFLEEGERSARAALGMGGAGREDRGARPAKETAAFQGVPPEDGGND